jgi:hypothetical protein
MENKDNDMTIEEFAELYNRTMDWNKDILDSIGDGFSGNECAKNIINEWLSIEKITPETCDYSSYEIFDTGCNEKELQIYNYTQYHDMYYWVCLDETEKEYKGRKIKNILHTIQFMLGKIEAKIEGLTMNKYNLTTLLGVIKDITPPEQEEQGNKQNT